MKRYADIKQNFILQAQVNMCNLKGDKGYGKSYIVIFLYLSNHFWNQQIVQRDQPTVIQLCLTEEANTFDKKDQQKIVYQKIINLLNIAHAAPSVGVKFI